MDFSKAKFVLALAAVDVFEMVSGEETIVIVWMNGRLFAFALNRIAIFIIFEVCFLGQLLCINGLTMTTF